MIFINGRGGHFKPIDELVASQPDLLPTYVTDALKPMSKRFPRYQLLVLDEVQAIGGGATKVTLLLTDISSQDAPQISVGVLQQVGEALVTELNSQTGSGLTAAFVVVEGSVSITFTPNTGKNE